jgi:hypothetical protein
MMQLASVPATTFEIVLAAARMRRPPPTNDQGLASSRKKMLTFADVDHG